MQWDRSIILSKYDIVCPIDKFLRKNPITSSFLEISTEGILNEQNNIQINKTSIKSQRLKYIETEEEATIIHPKVPPTDKAMETIARIYGIQEDTLKKNLKLAKDSDLLVKQIKELMSPLLNKNLNNEYLFNKLKVLDDHNKGSLKLLDYLTEFTQIKLRWLEQENQKLKIEKLKSLKYEAYHEQYSFPLSESYEIFDHPQALSSPSKWSYSKNNLLGHENAITQTSNINCLDPNGCTASFLILKYKEYYDGLIETSILLRDSDTMGILFRYKDAFNYYAFEMKQQGRGWKRIRKVVKGVSSIVSYVEDGGYLQNIWYKVILIFRSDEFIVKMAQENLNLPTDSIPIVIRTESQELKRGRVGFLTNGEQVFYIDGFSVKPLDCITEPEIPDIRYLPPECSRFKENYYGQMNLRWNVVNPENFFDGPALWDFETDFLGKEKVIYQKTGIFSPSPEKIATFAVLNFDKFCRNGVISVEFFAQNQGMVGVAFKYINSNNYYILEIGGDENKFIQMRKRINGKYSIISKNESIGYQIKQWHRVSIVMMDSIYTIYFSNVGEAPISIFDAIENKDLPEGTIALSTYKTEAAFDNVKISPFTDWMQGNTDLLHSNQEAGLYEDEELEQNQKEKSKDDQKRITWAGCVNTRTPESRKKYCEVEFEKEESQILGCYVSFNIFFE